MKKFWTLAALALLFACETQETTVNDSTTPGREQPGETENPTEPAVTGEVSDITEISAILSGRVNPTADMQDVLMGIFYSTESSPNIENSVKVRAQDIKDNAFLVSLDGLSSKTTYYFKTYLQYNGEQYYFGEVQSFTTLAVKASVETLGVTDVSEYKATLNARLEVDSKEDLSKSVWFLYGKDDNLEDLLANGLCARSSLTEDGTFSATLQNLDLSTEYHYVALARVYDKDCFGEVLSFVSWGYTYIGEAIDLGLSVKWSSMNLGATLPEEFGAYFAWGETEPNSYYDWSTYQWCNGSNDSLTKYNTDEGFGAVDYKTQLEASDDVASEKLGDKFRMPTNAEFEELINNCKVEWTTLNGVKGRKFTSKKTGFTDRWIFLPAVGYRYYSFLAADSALGFYWSSSLYLYYQESALCLIFDSSNINMGNYARCGGLSVRPVSE